MPKRPFEGGGHRGGFKKRGRGRGRGGGGRGGGYKKSFHNKRPKFEHRREIGSHEGSYAYKGGAPSRDADIDDRNASKKKVAVILGYCGAKYQGLQMNPGASTIEAELEKSMYEAGLIKKENFGNLQKIGWSRTGRTDKGVHAAAQVVACKLQIKYPEKEGSNKQQEEGEREGEDQSSSVKKEEAGTVPEADAASSSDDGGVNDDVVVVKETESESADGKSHDAEVKKHDDESKQQKEEEESTAAPEPADTSNNNNAPRFTEEEELAALDQARDAVNAKLPSAIRVHKIIRVSKTFNAKTDCMKRRYCYLLPTFLLQNATEVNPLLETCCGEDVKKGGMNEDEEAIPQGEEEEDDDANDDGSDAGDEEDNAEELEEGTVAGEDEMDQGGEDVENSEQKHQQQASDPIPNGDRENDMDKKKDKQRLPDGKYDPGYPWPDKQALRGAYEKLKTYRVSPERQEKLRTVLKSYLGTHKFHNFSIRLSWRCPQSSRYIMSVEVGEPFIRDGLEWVQITILGQAFLLHQIRKMVAVAVQVARGATPISLIERAYGDQMISLPMAPSAGLYLDKANFDRYVHRAQQNAVVSLDWENNADMAARIKEFREKSIIGYVTSQEASSLTFTNWLYHTCFKYDKQGDKAFEPREMTLAEQRSEGGGTKKENQQTRGGGGRGRGGRGGRR